MLDLIGYNRQRELMKGQPMSSANCNTGFGTCSWMRNSTDTMICKLMLGGNLSHGQDVWLDCTELYPPIWAA